MWIILFFDEHIRFKNCAIDEAQQVFWGLLGLDTNALVPSPERGVLPSLVPKKARILVDPAAASQEDATDPSPELETDHARGRRHDLAK